MKNEVLIPITSVLSAIVAFLGSYFTMHRKVSQLDERIVSLNKSHSQILEELKHLRDTKEGLAIQREKLNTTNEEVRELRTMQQTINLLQLRLQSLETKFEYSVEQILTEIKKGKHE